MGVEKIKELLHTENLTGVELEAAVAEPQQAAVVRMMLVPVAVGGMNDLIDAHSYSAVFVLVIPWVASDHTGCEKTAVAALAAAFVAVDHTEFDIVPEKSSWSLVEEHIRRLQESPAQEECRNAQAVLKAVDRIVDFHCMLGNSFDAARGVAVEYRLLVLHAAARTGTQEKKQRKIG